MSIEHPDAAMASDSVDEHSRYAHAQNELSRLVDAAVQSRRIEAMQHSVQVGIIASAVDFAIRGADAFTSPRLSPARRRELARRAVTAELATALRVPEQTMLRLIDEACALCTALPATLAALRAGSIDYAHARVVIETTNDVGDDVGTRSRLDAELAARATETNPATLRRIARRLREQVQAETLAERHARAFAARRVELEAAHDGMAWLHVHLAASDAMLIRDRIQRVAAQLANADESTRGVAGDPEPGSRDSRTPDSRTPDQMRADIARDLLLHGMPPTGDALHDAAAAVRPTVHVTVPVLTLLKHADEPGELDGYGPIDPETARRLAAQAPSFTRLLTHPIDGTVLDVDRNSYRTPADLKRWLRVRDETCRFPGCSRRAARCEIDHSLDWDDDGRTAFDNLAHVCPAHHHLKHETSWSVRHLASGTLEWTSPTGRRHTTRPPRTMGPARRGDPPGKKTSRERPLPEAPLF
jgi:Domain of unknown function (DUF222)